MLLAPSPRLRRFKIAFSLLALSAVFSVLFTAWRTQRLLANSRVIAARSAGFSRDYYLGNGQKLTYLVMGDSTAAGWGAGDQSATYPHHIAMALAARGRRVHLINVAVGGATLAEVQRGQSAALKAVKPDLVSLSVGANDATHRTADADFRREMRALHADFAASSARQVLIANVPDMFLAPALPYPAAVICGRRARALNAVLGSLPPKPKIHLVDIFGRGKLDYRRDAGLYAADLFHPSARGYAIWARLFVEKLE